MKPTAWSEVVDFVNGSPPYVSRGMLLNDYRLSRFSPTLIETYRLYLTRAGYLKHVARGIYRVAKHVPLRLTSKECYRRAYKKKRSK